MKKLAKIFVLIFKVFCVFLAKTLTNIAIIHNVGFYGIDIKVITVEFKNYGYKLRDSLDLP